MLLYSRGTTIVFVLRAASKLENEAARCGAPEIDARAAAAAAAVALVAETACNI